MKCVWCRNIYRRKSEVLYDCVSRLQEINGLRTLMTECPEDKDMLDMATEELDQAVEEEKRVQNLLLKSLLPKDDADERDCILEVRAGRQRCILMNKDCGHY